MQENLARNWFDMKKGVQYRSENEQAAKVTVIYETCT
jgi:hypothetical protein